MNSKLEEFVGRLKAISSRSDVQEGGTSEDVVKIMSLCLDDNFNTEDDLRIKRAEICFPIVNRGQVWYDSLTAVQRAELLLWYNDWLNVTETKKIPDTPCWIK